MSNWWAVMGHAPGWHAITLVAGWLWAALVRWGEVVAGMACSPDAADPTTHPSAHDSTHDSTHEALPELRQDELIRDEARRGLAEIEHYLAGLDH